MDYQLFILFFTNAVTAMSYLMPVPLFPDLAYSRGFSETFVGLVLAVFAVATLILIPYTNSLITYFGRRNMLVWLIILKVFFL